MEKIDWSKPLWNRHIDVTVIGRDGTDYVVKVGLMYTAVKADGTYAAKWAMDRGQIIFNKPAEPIKVNLAIFRGQNGQYSVMPQDFSLKDNGYYTRIANTSVTFREGEGLEG